MPCARSFSADLLGGQQEIGRSNDGGPFTRADLEIWHSGVVFTEPDAECRILLLVAVLGR